MLDIEGRTAKKRRRARIRGGIGMLVCGVIAVTLAGFAVAGAFSLASDQADQQAYDKAPYCAGSAPRLDSCVLRTTAHVDFVEASRNTGKSAHGYTTKAYLAPQVGAGQTVVLSHSDDLTDEVNDGDSMAVLVWHDQITRFTFSGKTHNADKNPHHIVAVDLAQVALCLIGSVIFGRPLIRRLLRWRIAINLPRNRMADWTLVTLALATPVAALLRASDAVVALGLTGVGALALSAVWPFIPWVATPSTLGTPELFPKKNQRRPRPQTPPRTLP